MKTIQQRRIFKEQKAKQEQKMIAAKENVDEEDKEIKSVLTHKRKRIDHKTGKILTLASTIFMLMGLAAFNSSAQGSYSGKERDTISREYQPSGAAYKAEIAQFKNESVRTIAENKKSIAKLTTKIAKDKALVNTEYKKQAAYLERQNNELEKKISDYNTTSHSEWKLFRTGFVKDMDALGASIKNFMKDHKL